MAAGAKAVRGSVRRRQSAPRPALASIPTVHQGVLMRSRLEARWAGSLGVPTGRGRLIGCRACDGRAKAAGVFGW
jgi:hypothetical protein